MIFWEKLSPDSQKNHIFFWLESPHFFLAVQRRVFAYQNSFQSWIKTFQGLYILFFSSLRNNELFSQKGEKCASYKTTF